MHTCRKCTPAAIEYLRVLICLPLHASSQRRRARVVEYTRRCLPRRGKASYLFYGSVASILPVPVEVC